MKFRKPLVALGAAGVLAALVIGGTAFAQTPTPNQQADTNYQSIFVDKLAAALGTTRDKLEAAFTQARNDTVDQEVKDGKLTQDQADKIKAQPANIPMGFGIRGHEGGPGGRATIVGGPQVRDAVATALGITTDELTSQLKSGKTLADLAQGKEQAVKDAIQGVVKPQLDQAVKDGKMTQDQENQMLDKIQNSDLSNGVFGLGGPHGGLRVWRNGSGAEKPAPSSSNPS